MKIGISLSTHSNKFISKVRYEIIEECLVSLEDNLPNDIYVSIICDDITDVHKKLLEKFNFNLIFKNEHGGVSKTKNTGINSILSNNCDIGFLCDDDLIFKDKNIFEYYVDSMVKSKIPHFSYFVDSNSDKCKIVKHNGIEIIKTPMVNGCFLSFDKELIQDVGYFKIMTHKFGHEHSNFTRRCISQGKIPFFCDIENSKSYLTVNKKSWENRTVFNMDSKMFHKNEMESISHLNKYSPLVE